MTLHHETIPGGGEMKSRYWLHDRVEGPRRVVVGESSVDGNHIRVLMSGVERSEVVSAVPGCEHLFVVRGGTSGELLERLGILEKMIGDDSIAGIAGRWHDAGRDHQGSLALAIVAETVEELREGIVQGRRAVEENRGIAGDRVFYSPAPLGREGKVAFVYPGSGNHFVGMGRELAVRFPQVLHRQERESGRLASQFAGGRLWDEKGATLSVWDSIFAQVSLGAFVTDVLGLFGVKPGAVIGYSLGESTGLFATRTWTGRDEMFGRMEKSTLFTADLTGECRAARGAWKLAAGERVEWMVGVVNRAAEEVRRVIAGRERVYLLIVNTSRECVIGGDRAAVEAVVRELGCDVHPIEGITTVHCEVARGVEGAYRDLHLLNVTPPPGVRFYSGAAGGSYEVTRESAAESIVRQAVGAFDFTKVIEAAYADGVRVFVEIGPGASCTRMIDQILGERPHFARSACAAGQNTVGSFLRLMAQLIAEGVAVDLDVLFEGRAEQGASGRAVA